MGALRSAVKHGARRLNGPVADTAQSAVQLEPIPANGCLTGAGAALS